MILQKEFGELFKCAIDVVERFAVMVETDAGVFRISRDVDHLE